MLICSVRIERATTWVAKNVFPCYVRLLDSESLHELMCCDLCRVKKTGSLAVSNSTARIVRVVCRRYVAYVQLVGRT
jgi:hypothetical protein